MKISNRKSMKSYKSTVLQIKGTTLKNLFYNFINLKNTMMIILCVFQYNHWSFALNSIKLKKSFIYTHII